jgi:hypothetical protein
MQQKPVQLPWSDALRKQFHFQTPPAFRELEARRLFQWQEKLRGTDLTNLTQPGDHYLWFNDMAWYQPDDLRSFRFENYHKSGFVPFAHAASGDYWCWYPSMQADSSVPVLLCPHDCYFADLFAPDFASALYRHALQYAAQMGEDPDRRNAMLKRWTLELGPLWPPKWRDHVERLAAAPITWKQYESIIAAEFGDRYVQHFQVRWMKEA